MNYKVLPAFLIFGRHPRSVKSLRREVKTQLRGLELIERIDPEVWQDRIKRLDALRDMMAKNIERFITEVKSMSHLTLETRL